MIPHYDTEKDVSICVDIGQGRERKRLKCRIVLQRYSSESGRIDIGR